MALVKHICCERFIWPSWAKAVSAICERLNLDQTQQDLRLINLSIAALWQKAKTRCVSKPSSAFVTRKLAVEKSSCFAKFAFVPIQRRFGNIPLRVRIAPAELKMSK